MNNAPTVLIADIEGAEQYLDLSGLPDSVRTIIMEVHPTVIGQEAVDHILNTLKSMRFTLRGWEENTFCREKGSPRQVILARSLVGGRSSRWRLYQALPAPD
ncbi:hypothetical protein [Verrucomicrobium spinosum]|uniref:hypothetical protein n=1 Tax=Verrucomicrobium spinosum TaxID=2736 RepID=UPI00094626E0|nr:hypothetical protein [Verrucomicrobium spinosum]